MPELASEARNTPVEPTSFTSTFRCNGARSACAFSICTQIADAASGQRFDRASRDGVDPDILLAQIVSKITYRAFQRGFGYAHHVVAGHNPLALRNRSW